MHMEPNHEGAASVPQTTGAPILPAERVYQDPSAPAGLKGKKELSIPFTGVDACFAILALVCGYLFVWLVNPLALLAPYSLGVGVTIFAACFYTTALLYMRKQKISPPKSSYGWLGLSMVSALYFALFSNGVLKFFNLFFCMIVTVYWIAAACGSRLEPSLGRFVVPDLLDQLFRIPFSNFTCGPKILRGAAGKSRRSKNALAAVLGILVAIPLVMVVGTLLTRADQTFARMVQEMTVEFGERLLEFLLRLLPAALVGCYFFGMFYGNLQKRFVAVRGKEDVEKAREKRRKLPPAMTVTVLALLTGVYLLFFGAQAATLFSAFAGVRPEGLTYAEYARQGFFELCGVAMINLAVLGGVRLFTVKKGETPVRPLVVFSVLLSAETLLLIVTALSKMVLYIQQYGLTLLRVYTSWFMVLLFIVFAIVIVAQFRRVNLAKALVLAFSICFLLLCYSNVDGLIARYNIGRYQAGTLDSVDLEALYATPEASLPYVKELYQETDDPALRAEIRNYWGGFGQYDVPFHEQNLEHFLAQENTI